MTVTLIIWMVGVGVLAAGYLTYRVGKALAAAADRRKLHQAIEKRERIAALHDLRGQYPRDSLTWQVLNDSIHGRTL